MSRRTSPSSRGYSPSGLEATISELAPGGAAVGHIEMRGERRAVFVARGAIGDRVRVRIEDTNARPLRGSIESFLVVSDDRVAEPRCASANECGGCDFIHLRLEAQRSAHDAIVRAQLRKHFIEPTTHRAKETLAYRSRARVHVLVKGPRVEVGMFADRAHTIIDAPVCVALHEGLDAARIELREMLAGSAGRGEAWLGLGGAVGTERRPVIALSFRGELAGRFFARAEALVNEGKLAGVAMKIEGADRIMRIGEPTPWTPGIDGEPVWLPPFGFAQAHEEINRELVRHVVELARRVTTKGPVGDWYAGAGNFTVALARDHEVTACESSAEAVTLLRENLRARKLKATVLENSAAEADIPPRIETLVLDPPRTGARDVVLKLPARVQNVIYVSCDAASFARDVRDLEARGFVMKQLDLFEMFPQTSHVETVALFARDPKH